MSDATKIPLGLLQRVAEFLEGLPEEHLLDLSEGRARITYIPWGQTEAVKPQGGRSPKPKVDMSEALAELERLTTREDAERYLTQFKVPELRALASTLDLGSLSKNTKANLVSKIVWRTVGKTLGSKAIRQL